MNLRNLVPAHKKSLAKARPFLKLEKGFETLVTSCRNDDFNHQGFVGKSWQTSCAVKKTGSTSASLVQVGFKKNT